MEEAESEDAPCASSGQEAEVQASDLQWEPEDEPLSSPVGVGRQAVEALMMTITVGSANIL